MDNTILRLLGFDMCEYEISNYLAIHRITVIQLTGPVDKGVVVALFLIAEA